MDEEGRPVESATVAVADVNLIATTDADGRFSLAEVPAGRHRLEANCTGFTGEVVDFVTVVSGATVDVVFRLIALQIPLKEIVVTAKASILRDQPAAAVALDRKAISELPHFGDDLYRAINVLPGTSGGDISARFSVRGGLYDETLVTLPPQGFPGCLQHSRSGDDRWGRAHPRRLHRQVRRPNDRRARHGDARRGYLDFILKAVGDDDDEGDPPDPKYWDAFGKLGYAPSPSHSLSFAFLLADDDLLFEEDDEDDFADVETGYTSRYVWLGHQGVVGSSSFVNTALYAGDVSTDRDFLISSFISITSWTTGSSACAKNGSTICRSAIT
jgi:hypothetical protein